MWWPLASTQLSTSYKFLIILRKTYVNKSFVWNGDENKSYESELYLLSILAFVTIFFEFI